jgi:hypothetical protein
VLLRLAYLGITNAFALLRFLPGSDRDKDVEILALRHQLAVLHRQLGGQRVRFEPADRAWLAALLHQLPRSSLHRLRLLVRPDTILHWHRDLLLTLAVKLAFQDRELVTQRQDLHVLGPVTHRRHPQGRRCSRAQPAAAKTPATAQDGRAVTGPTQRQAAP